MSTGVVVFESLAGAGGSISKFTSAATGKRLPFYVRLFMGPAHNMASPRGSINISISMRMRTSKTEAEVLYNLILEVIFHPISVFCWSQRPTLIQWHYSKVYVPGGRDHWRPFWRLATTENKRMNLSKILVLWLFIPSY